MAVRAKIWFFCLLFLSSTAPAQQPSTIQVGVVPAEKMALADTNRFVGRIEAIERVDVRARERRRAQWLQSCPRTDLYRPVLSFPPA